MRYVNNMTGIYEIEATTMYSGHKTYLFVIWEPFYYIYHMFSLANLMTRATRQVKSWKQAFCRTLAHVINAWLTKFNIFIGRWQTVGGAMFPAAKILARI